MHAFGGRGHSDIPNGWYTNKRWRALRLDILRRDSWQCQMCSLILEPGRTSDSAAVVDHKKPAGLRPDLFHDPDNLWALCKKCHDATCATIEARHWPDADAIASGKLRHRPIGDDGWPAGGGWVKD